MKKLKLKKSIKILILIIFILLIFIMFKIYKKDNDVDMETKIKINNNVYKVVLEDNSTSREFLNRLPLDITMHDLNDNEKYYYMKEVLPNNPESIKEIKAGDIMLYGNNCLVIFYENFTTYYEYTKIGHIENVDNLKSILGSGDIKLSIYEGK